MDLSYEEYHQTIMERKTLNFSSANISTAKLLNWAKKYDVFTLLNSNSSVSNPEDKYSCFDLLLAADPANIFSAGELFPVLDEISQCKDWFILHLTYDIKNSIEDLHSCNPDQIHFPEFFIYQPAIIFKIKDQQLSVEYLFEKYSEDDIKRFIEEIINLPEEKTYSENKTQIRNRLTRDEYISEINAIRKHIQLGDIYEMNYCQEFYSEDADIDPVQTYLHLNDISPMPFSVFSKTENLFLLCASPERYLARRKHTIISQPIKGTARRGTDEESDKAMITALKNDEKERSENVMIVDLVRNDLSKTAEKGSVHVEELFSVKTFLQLHQMISTVTSKVAPSTGISDLIRTTFPMGSMTGAPKIRAMEIIEHTEKTKRGLYSGSVGYLSPDGDFDLNVVIRSILYNAEKKYLSFTVGSAITNGATAESEYEECLLKAGSMKKLFTS